MRGPVGLVGLWVMGCVPVETPPPVESDTPTVDSDSDLPDDSDPVDTVDTVEPIDTVQSSACEPPLTATAEVTVALGLTSVVGTGGTGDYRFDTLDEGDVHPTTGLFFAPATAGQYRVEMTDAGCDGSAEALIEVFSRLQMRPTAATLLPNSLLRLDVTGGSGDWSCTRVSGGGEVSPDCVVRVPESGFLLVRAVDHVSGDVVESTLIADPDAGLAVDPGQALVLPVGGTHQVTTQGGTGIWEIASQDPSVASINGDVVTALSAGGTTITVTDVYTNESSAFTVQILEPLQTPLGPRFGDVGRYNRVVQPGDIDGDGVPDIFFGDPDISQEAYRGGSVLHIQLGDTPTLDATRHGTWTQEQVGTSLALLDADGDGLEDLVVGALLPDEVANDSGRVDIYRRTSTGFEAAPWLQLYGDAGDRHGEAVGACDVNGDGFDDLIVGVTLAEDDTALVDNNNQGAVWVYHGSPTGLQSQPAEVRYGQVWGDSGWEHVEDLRMGGRLSTGDVNGDGLCDIAVGQHARLLGGDSTAGGFLHLYLGDATTGLSPFPVRSFEGSAEVNEFAYDSVMGDLDGDGRDELIIGHPRQQQTGESDRGATYVYSAGALDLALDEGAILVAGAEADWTARGVANSDLFGDALQLADADGDGTPDLFIGAALSEYGDEPSGGGNIMVFLADRIAADIDAEAPDPSALEADHLWHGPESAAVGSGFAVLEDLDADGWPEVLARGPRDDSLGRDVGQYWVLTSDPLGAHAPLGYPGIAAERLIGESVLGLEVDGAPVAVVAAPYDGLDDRSQPGALHALDLITGELLWSPPLHSTQSDGDRAGWSLSAAGDVDGDGLGPDLLVAAYNDERDNNLDDYNVAACDVPVQSNAGGALLYRRVADGLWLDAPSAAFYGPTANGHGLRVVGGYDFDGDGFDDMALSSDDHHGGDTGGVRIHFGRTLGDGLELLCDPVDLVGAELDGHFGRSMAGLHDLDGDGCDELAVGAYREALVGHSAELELQGTVRVFFGLGESCATRGVVTLASGDDDSQAGYALASGDLDGDGLDDLAIGVRSTQPAGSTVGSVWMVRGSEIDTRRAAPWWSATTGVASVPATADITPAPMAPALLERLSVWGKRSGGFGDAVAIVPWAGSDTGMALVVGAPLDDEDGADAGEVTVYRWVGDGLDRIPSVRIRAGDLDANLGHSVGGAEGFVVFGAPWADVLSPDSGAAFSVELP